MKLTLSSLAIVISFVMTGCNDKAVATDQSSTKSTPLTTASSQKFTNINNDKLKKMLDEGVTLVDIRLPEEWASTGIIKGSKKLTFFSKTGGINPNLQQEMEQLVNKDKPVMLICRTGSRTRYASQMLNEIGYTKVYNVTNGITHWIREGRPTIK